MMYDDDKRCVLTLDAGGTNFVFSAIQGGREIVEPIRLDAVTEDAERCLKRFLEEDSCMVPVPGTDRSVRYRKGKKTGITVSALGTSRAIALGAYTYALSRLDA